ncbi:synaptotagmin-7-like [Periplaneta americana]|uniref:synaptotagmin-7-like n=1 Tax=Periplaneta americana TaxID=6978 RepID=UPI0037E7022D
MDIILKAVLGTLGAVILLFWFQYICRSSKKKAPQSEDSTSQMVPRIRVTEYLENGDSEALSALDMCEDILKDTPQFLGTIKFSVTYDAETSVLKVQVIEADRLPECDTIVITCDPYVKVSLLPERNQEFQTRVRKGTFHPKWMDIFYFDGLSIQKLQHQVLQLFVYDYDTISRDDPIGAVLLPFSEVTNLSNGQCKTFTKELKVAAPDCGDLQTIIWWSELEINVVVTKGRQLRIRGLKLKLDPYVKVTFLKEKKVISTHKTKIVKNTMNPNFNESFSCSAPVDRLNDYAVEIEVMHNSGIGKGDLVGRIVLADKDATGVSERNQWQKMVAFPGESIMQWHRLKQEIRVKGRKVLS